ncbi:hypothetical protein PFNF54_02131 [Plasmodium falciparum NF54]|uniref:Uncharacterized protein n=1 Tax=Plasmodium falciparum (isolate NF54) TaxID=5843 RepID=W7JX12_PLAFO|nr:hypothetical protein PFNF54_02131 [Plasmodium falciparum NF54]
MMEKKVYVNLDDQYIDEDIIKTENMLFKIPEAIGGYTFINYIENVPNNYIFPINKNELTSFEEYIYNQKKEKNKQSKKDKYKKLQECVSTYNSFHDKIKDDEDERFEYFKLYEGIHVYKKEEINISHLWRNLHKEYLKIRKVNFFNTFNIKNSLNLLRHKKNKNSHDQQNEEKNDVI